MLKQVLRLGEGQPAHCLSFIKILDNSLQNVHRVCPEEVIIVNYTQVARGKGDELTLAWAIIYVSSRYHHS